ncbi:hypothetical protein ACOALZ_10895 [Nocardiopsis algeriensis]|uniref:hypothetical protein n=1 Tax=Nocardiopsis algeriensis TaxID=1478215 RepID=UPI003B43A8E3
MSAHQVQAERVRVLEQAYAAQPHRFASVPVPPPLPKVVHTNPLRIAREEETAPGLGEPAA